MEKGDKDGFRCRLLSWEEAHAMSREISKKILASGRPDVIIGITRGGWVPSVLISDLIGVKELYSLRVTHWGVTAKKDARATIKVPLSADLAGKKALIVDDLTDTGESMKIAVEHAYSLRPAKIETCTLIHKDSSGYTPDYYASREEKWRWIILPWNIREDLTNLAGHIRKEGETLSHEEIRDRLSSKFGLDIDVNTLREVL